MCIAHCTRKSFQWDIFNLRWGNKNEHVKFWLKSQQAIAFIPMAAESLGGWQKVALEQLGKLGSALARHTGQEEGETISHLLTRASVLLQKGLSSLLLNRIPGHPSPAIGGTQWWPRPRAIRRGRRFSEKFCNHIKIKSDLVFQFTHVTLLPINIFPTDSRTH